MLKSINIYSNISEYESDYDNRDDISLSLIIDNTVVNSHDKDNPNIVAVCFTVEEAGSTIGLNKLSSYQTLEYCKDITKYQVWENMTTSTNITLENIGDKVYIRGLLSGDNSQSDYTQFKMTGKIAASGNCNALWNYHNSYAGLKAYCGYNMFSRCSALTQAPELPATSLAIGCYYWMFDYCKSLTQAPELPATTLAENCYHWMFNYCTSLTTAPALPATTLADFCYESMFNYCTSLTTAPALPATILVDGCYASMFSGCTSLTQAPELPATKLVSGCYYYMFYDCSNLNYIKCLATDISATNCTFYWVPGVASTGTFVQDANADWQIGTHGIPIGWEVKPYNAVTFTAEEAGSTVGLSSLSSNQTLEYRTQNSSSWENMTTSTNITLDNIGDKVYMRGFLSNGNTLSNYTQFTMSGKISSRGNCNALWNYNDLNAPLKEDCGWKMFSNCTSLTQAPELPATTLAYECYGCMFSNCTSLTTAPELPATTLASSCYGSMFRDCTSLTTAPALIATTLRDHCYDSMFDGCTSLTKAQELPATTLESYCYREMFYGCTSLTTAPELPATTLTYQCYYGMFSGCSNLNYIKCLATDISATDCTTNFVNGVSSTGVFVKAEGASWSTGVSAIPYGWEVGEVLTLNLNENEILTFTAEEAGSTIGLNKLSIYQKIKYSINYISNTPSSWINMNTSTNITLDNVGDKVYVIGVLSGNNTSSIYTQFKMTGKIAASGNCNSLWDYNDLNAPLRQYYGYKLFNDCTSLTTAPKLPATTLASSCYDYMFSGCTGLTTAPELPATTVGGCYEHMFQGCTSLTKAPELPATTLTNQCYYYMFSGCTNLTQAPELPATKLADRCYYRMFEGCTSLTKAPELPATTLAQSCYGGMFSGCTSLTTAPALIATTLSDGCYAGIFEGCTSLTKAPELPATTLESSCYQYMFQNCTSLTTAPELPATTLEISCYEGIFSGCTNLVQAPELPATTLAQSCYFSMFNGCTGLTTAPELPATTLASRCYQYMFYGCTGLTQAPDLPSTTLKHSCYYSMFSGCSNLNYIKCLATDISATNCTYNWVSGVAPTGTFVKDVNSSWTVGINGIPEGWTVEEGAVTFTAEEAGSTIGLNKLSSYQTLEYKTASSDWTSMNESTNITLDNIGDKVYVRGVLSGNNTSSNYTRFKMTGKIAASGNCNALWSCNDLNAPLKEYCGYMMFYYCTSLTTAPELPATTLASSCYRGMFFGCTSLTTAPSILPATKLSIDCYNGMFQGCTSLTTAPELPAKTLVEYCYRFMFEGCYNLNYIKCLATDMSVTDCKTNWVDGVSTTGTFVKAADTSWSTGIGGIPSGWTVIEEDIIVVEE